MKDNQPMLRVKLIPKNAMAREAIADLRGTTSALMGDIPTLEHTRFTREECFKSAARYAPHIKEMRIYRWCGMLDSDSTPPHPWQLVESVDCDEETPEALVGETAKLESD